MEKTLFREKVDSMIPAIIEDIRMECDKLYSCGGVDTEAYEDDFILPKICLTIALENQSHQLMPLHPDYKKVVRNLRHF